MLLEPHLVTTYLLELASAFNAWYAQEQILDDTPAAAHKVALVEAVGRTLKNGLWILGYLRLRKCDLHNPIGWDYVNHGEFARRILRRISSSNGIGEITSNTSKVFDVDRYPIQWA